MRLDERVLGGLLGVGGGAGDDVGGSERDPLVLADELFVGVRPRAWRARRAPIRQVAGPPLPLLHPRAQPWFPTGLSALGPWPSASQDLRNIAIVAHVDHGKTTLVDAMLRQSGAFRDNEEVNDRVMDSNDLEREKGITILAKNTAVRYRDVKINIIDTPGHADFGGEVERGLTMVDGVLLLVDASEGPLPQTRFVLRKALERGCRSSWSSTRSTGPTRASTRSSTRSTSCSSTSTPTRSRSSSRSSTQRAGGPRQPRARRDGLAETSTPLLDPILDHIPAPAYDPDFPLQAHVTNLDASLYVGRLALCRVRNGTIRKGQRSPGAARRDDRERPSRRPLRHRRARPRRPRRPGRARSSPSPASPRSRSARPSPTPTTRARCR